MKRASYFWILLGILIIIFLIPIVVYYFNFRNFGISHQPCDWSSFSGFVGGIINPIFAIINILVLVWLTITVARYQNNSNLNNLKYNSIKDFQKLLANLTVNVNSFFTDLNNKHVLEIGLLRLEFMTLVAVNKPLFSCLTDKEKSNDISNQTIELTNYMIELSKKTKTEQDEILKSIVGGEIEQKIKTLFNGYSNFMGDMLKELNINFGSNK
jgi:uncharacterized membrane protein